jgi:arylsulfatase A-like enzyme
MAEEGVVFENSFCTHPTCSPSRASIFTGRYPHSTGVMGLTHDLFRWKLNDDEVHLAQFLGERGYTTALIGGYHEHRWDEVDRLGYQLYDPAEYGEDKEGGFRPAAVTAAQAVAFLTAHQYDREPFYLGVGFFEPHWPFDYGGCHPDEERGVYVPGYIPQETGTQKAAARREFSELQGAIKEVDGQIGRILDAVKATGREDNTIILFTVDHGLAVPRAKGSLYDPGIETCLIIKAPCLSVPAGGRKSGLVSNVDYFPTLVEALGFDIPDRVEGISFLDYLHGGNEHRGEIFAEKNYHGVYDPRRCIRTPKYKYIINFHYMPGYVAPGDVAQGPIYKSSLDDYWKKGGRYELYDLEQDRWEADNLAGQRAYVQIERDLRHRLLAWMRDTNDPLLQGPIACPFYEETIYELEYGPIHR